MLASLLYPYDEDAPSLIDSWLTELEDQGHVRRYAVDGNTYIEIIKFLQHQKIDKPSPSKLPTSENIREDSTKGSEPSPQYLVPSIKDQGSVSGPRTGIEPEMVARGLAERLGLSLGYGPSSLNTAVTEVAITEMKAGRNLEEVALEMEAAYRFYEQEKPTLRITWGPAKFFGDGHWRNPEGWPRKEKTRAQKMNEWRAPDDDEGVGGDLPSSLPSQRL
jgi:hypothetical protein